MESSKRTATDLLYGFHSLFEVLKAKKRKVAMIYTTKPTPKWWHQVEPLLPKYVPIQYVARDVLTRMAGTTDHQGVVAYAQPLVIRKAFFDPKKESFLMMLDRIQDPRNVGAILRSAYCTGVQGVIVCKKEGAPLNATAHKSSAGLAEHLSIFEAVSSEQAVQLLVKAGYHNYLAVLDGTNAVTCNYQEPLCIIIGNEAVGIAPHLKKYGTAITLPQVQKDISYNASVAAGILLFTVAQKLQKI